MTKKVQWITVSLLLCVGLAGVVAGILRFGNPQWNRWIYVCQAYYPPQRADWNEPPENYTGVWRHWQKDGKPGNLTTYRDGAQHGPLQGWDTNGTLVISVQYRNGHIWEGQWYEKTYHEGKPLNQ